MKSRYVLWMGGFILALTIVIAGCQSAEPVKPKESEKKPPVQPAKEKKQAKDIEKKEKIEVVGKTKEEKAEKILQDMVRDRLLTKEQQETFIDHLIKTARAKISVHDYTSAKTFLDQALRIDPTNADALKLRNLVGTFLGEYTSKIESVHGMYEQEVKVKIEQAKLEAQNHYKNGLSAFQKKDYQRAIREFEAALEIIKWAPYQLGLDSLRKQAELKIKEARYAKEKWTTQLREQKMKEARLKAEQLEAEERAQRLTQIRILLARSTEFYTRQKYDKAQAMVEQVLEIDPANKTAKRLQEDIRDASHAYISQKTLESKMEEWKRFLELMKKAAIPTSQLLLYPDKEYWHNVISKRKSEAQLGKIGITDAQEDTPAIRKIRTKLKTLPITLNFSETPFQDVIRYIQTLAEINIVIDTKITHKFEIEGTKVNLQVNDVKLQDALNILLQFHNLTYLFKDDVLFITAKDSQLARGKAILVLHDIRDLTGQIKDFPGPRIKLLPSKGQDSSGGATFEEEPSTGGAVLTGEKLTELIKSSIEPDTWDKEQFSIAETSGQLLVVHTKEVQEKIRDFLNDMRRFSGTMVAIESRFLEITDDFLEHLGIDWRGIGDNQLQQNDTNITTDDNRVGLTGLTSGTEDNAGGTNDNNGNSFVPSAGAFFRQSVKDRQNVNGVNTQRGNFDIRSRTEHIDEQTLGTRLRKTGGLSIQLATMDDMQLSAVLWMVKKTGRGELLMAPRLTAFNTQRANLTVVDQQSYIKDFDVEVAQSAYIADPVIGTIQSGVVLDVRPTISNDRKYITLELRPTIATLVRFRDFNTSLGASGREVTFQIPELRLQSVETTVRIPDQGTLMIGGLKTYRNADHKQDVPFLGDIPIISFFFSQRSKVDEKQDLLILIKAKIIDLEEEEEKAVGTPK